MGSTYSLNGFINAALRRTNRTVLVEGPTDKHTLHKVAIERFPSRAGAAAIDHAGMIDDPALAGLGNKAKVLAVQAQVDALTGALPKLPLVLATLTDREWDGISFVSYAPHPQWSPPSQLTNRFTTLGHSLENYHFDSECALEFLKYAFPEHLSSTALTQISDRFEAILVFATVLSLKIRDDSCIGRCSGLIDTIHIHLRGDRVYLEPSFGAACAARNVPTSASIVADTNSAIDLAWANLQGKPFTQWLPHGHIGEELIWSGIAKVASQNGVPGEIVNEIAHGHKKERERFKAMWLSKASPARRHPLDSVVDWLHP